MKYPKWYIIRKISGPGDWEYKYVKRTSSKIWDLIIGGEEFGLIAYSPKQFVERFARYHEFHNNIEFKIEIHSKMDWEPPDVLLKYEPRITTFDFDHQIKFEFVPIEKLHEKENK